MSKNWQIFLFFLVLFALLTRPDVSSWSDASRMATIQSLVEHHSFIIDNSQFTTNDKYFYQGHFYSDKPPNLAIYGSVFYLLLKGLGISFSNHYNLTYYLLTLLVVGVSTCIGLVYFYKTIKLFGVDDKWADVLVLVTATGTLILPYSTVFNNHTVTGVLLVMGFYYLVRIKESVKYALFAGLLIALAGSIDITAFSFIPFSAIVLVDKPLKSKITFTLACAVVILVYFLLNLYTSGSLTPPAMNKALWEYRGPNFGDSSLSGLAYHPNISSQLNYGFHMLVGNRGLISYTPLLAFSIFGFAKVFSKNFKYRKEYLFIILGSLAYILMYIFRSNNYSGSSYGVRWYADLMFLLCLPLANIGNEIKNSKKLKTLFFIISSISIVISSIGIIAPFVPVKKDSNSFISCFIYIFKYPIFSLEFMLLFTRLIVIAIATYYILTMLRLYYKKFLRT